ncbi:MAG: choice-of-anchor D domain-containing protein [Terriglobales bacterium]
MVITLLGASLPSAYASHPRLVCNPPKLWFGKVVTGQTETLAVTVTNAGSSSITVSEVNVSNAAFTVNGSTLPQTLDAGQSVQFSVSFSPPAVGSVNGTLAFSSNAGTLNFFANGSGVAGSSLTASPPSLNFGTVAVGGSSTLPLTINNPGTTSQTVSAGTVGGTGFSATGFTLPLILSGGQSFTFNVTFTPATAGAFSGSILATGPSIAPLSVALSGAGGAVAGQLTSSPGTINFGNVTVGQSAIQSGQLAASISSVTVSSATMSNPGFALSGMSLPLTLAVGQTVNYTITFSPQSSGAVSGSLSLASNAANSPTVESLAGTGNSASYSVNLSWQPSASQVAGYNVYRGNQSGGPYSRINSGLETNTAYTDSSVVEGQTYYYATTAVNSEGQESNYSNLVQAVIP